MSKTKFVLSLAGGAATGFIAAKLAWALAHLPRDPQRTLAAPQNRAPGGTQFFRSIPGDGYDVEHSLEDGIERVTYRPHERRFETPLLFQHGMWHGAWVWEGWQAAFARWGWESHAISLPGHGGSPAQQPVALATLDYYLSFLRQAAARLPRPPALIGHSMGGGLAQWYLKYLGDLPAAVLVAPWVSHAALADGLPQFLRLDPAGVLLILWSWDATGFVRTPERAHRALLSRHAPVAPEELHRRLGPESTLVMLQHNPPFWQPPDPGALDTPLLWIAAAEDALISEPAQRRSASYYGADYIVVPTAGHNLTMEHNAQQTAQAIHDWLAQKVD